MTGAGVGAGDGAIIVDSDVLIAGTTEVKAAVAAGVKDGVSDGVNDCGKDSGKADVTDGITGATAGSTLSGAMTLFFLDPFLMAVSSRLTRFALRSSSTTCSSRLK
jgi:hypothetical protein